MLKIDYSKLVPVLDKFVKRPESMKVLFIRNAESAGNLSGSLNGWMDFKLTDYGRKQAFALNEVLIDFEDKFDQFH